MANTSVIYARVDTNLKESAEEILSRLGITPSSAIQMFYRQILIKKGIPFELTLPSDEVIILNNTGKKSMIDEVIEEIEESQKDKMYSYDEIIELLNKYNK